MRRLPTRTFLGILVAGGLAGAFAGGCNRPAPPPPPRPETVVQQPAVPQPRAAAEKPATPVQTPRPDAAATSDAAAPTAQPADPLPSLRQALAAAADENSRVLAVDDIAKLGQNAKGALDDLLPLLADGDVRTRWHAARAVGMIGEDAIIALPKLVGMLGDPDPIVATQSAAAIARIRRDDGRASDALPASDAASYETALQALIAATVHPDARVRRSALRAIETFSPKPELLAPLFNKQLSDADPSVVLPALHSLADLGAVSVPLLMESLKNPRSRYWAELALAEIGPAAAPAVDLLVQTLADGEPEERVQAILALGAIGERAQPAVADLVRAVESQDRSLQLAATFALASIGAAEADAALERLTAHADPFLASVAAWARAKISPDDAELRGKAVASLTAGLTSSSPNVRSGSISALSDLATGLDDATCGSLAQAFVEQLTDADPEVQTAAAAALVRLRGRGVPALGAALDDPERRTIALELLAGIGPAAAPTLERLTTLLQDADPAVAGDAALALAALGPAAAPAVPELAKMLADAPAAAAQEGDVAAAARQRFAAIYALGRIGPAAQAAAERVRELSRAPEEFLATVATWAALKISPEDASLFESAVPLLRRALRGEREIARLEAAVALGDIGAGADSAIPILELVSEDDSSASVRAAAVEAIKKIRGR
jgi:HEAT repeat protein